MKLPNAKIESFINRPDDGVKAVLLYGPDSGLVSLRSKKIQEHVLGESSDPFRYVQYVFNDIKDDAARLADEINAISLMGGRRFIRIVDVGALMPESIGQAIKSSKSDTMVVIEAGELTPASSLRKFFEKEDLVAAIPCYKDDMVSIRKVIEAKFMEIGLSWENEVISYLSSAFSGDRLIILSEIEKLKTYIGDKKNITIEDAKACVGDNVESSIDELCMAAASRDLVKVEKTLQRILSEGVGAIAPVRGLMRYFFRMQQVKANMAANMTEQEAISALRPPVFYKNLGQFKSHINQWGREAIDSMILSLLNLESECKKTGSPSELLLTRLLCVTIARRKKN